MTFFPTLQASSAPDTLVALATRDSLAMAADVAMVVVGVAVVITMLLLSRLILQGNRTLKELRGGVKEHLGPVSHRARSISDNVEFISQVLRSDVERLAGSVRALSERLQQASDHMEARIEEFNALLEVVQGEAEDLFLDTAATVRGVKAGARSVAAPQEQPRAMDGARSGAGTPAKPYADAVDPELPARAQPASDPQAEGVTREDEG